MNPRVVAWFLAPLFLGCAGPLQKDRAPSFPDPDVNFLTDLPVSPEPIEGVERGVVTVTDPDADEFATIDRRPSPIERSIPEYPKDLLANRVSGSVAVTFLVDKRGVTRSILVEAGSDPRFVARVIETVGKWRYRPAKVGGQAIAWRMRALFEFKTSDERQPNQALQTTPMTRSGSERTIVFERPQRGV